jgi:uncharacterized protein YkwD
MARSRLALVAVLPCFAVLAAGTAQAKSTTHASASCAAAKKASRARKGTLSFHHAHCPKGKAKNGSPSHLLYFKAVNGQCPDATLAPSATNVAQVRAATLCIVNRERSHRGETSLRWNNHLVAAAQAHTESMAFGDYFEHIGPRGETPLARMRRTGYIYSSRLGFEVGENIGWGSLWLGTPKAVVAAWMASPGHRANILDRHFRETGIGVSPHLGTLAGGQSGGIYTQDFGVITGG